MSFSDKWDRKTKKIVQITQTQLRVVFLTGVFIGIGAGLALASFF